MIIDNKENNKGKKRTGQDRTGRNGTGLGGTGQDRKGQDWTGQDRPWWAGAEGWDGTVQDEPKQHQR